VVITVIAGGKAYFYMGWGELSVANSDFSFKGFVIDLH